MAAEWWAPPGKLRLRLAACGHTVIKQASPTPYHQNGNLLITCPECGLVQSPTTNVRDGVPSVSLTWGEAACTSRLDFHLQLHGQGPIGSIKGLLQAMSAPGTTSIDLAREKLQLGRVLQQKGPADSLVLRAWPSGCTVTGGSVQLPRAVVLLLTGRGVLFQGTKFTGGLLVCCGDGFSGAFHGCEFHECTVYAVHGATVTLRGCTHHNGFPAAVAHGAGTTLHLVTCTLAHCLSDIHAERGATVAATQCRSSRSIHSLIARNPGTSMSCRDCSFVTGGYGVQAQDSRVLLRGCSVKSFEYGVVADGPQATMELHGCDVLAGVNPVAVREGAAAMLRETRLSVDEPKRAMHAQQAPGARAWLVCMDGSECGTSGGVLQAERCTLRAAERDQLGVAVRWHAAVAMVHCDILCGGNGVSVCEGGRVATLAHCAVQSVHSAACFVEKSPCTLRVDGGRLAGGQCAGVAAKEGSLVVRDAVASGLLPGGASMCVITTRLGGKAALVRCVLRDALLGVFMVRGVVYATDVTVAGLVSPESATDESDCSAGFRQYGGTLSVSGGSVTGCAIAACVQSESDDKTVGSAAFHGVKFDGNGISIRVCDDANCEVTAAHCEFRGGGKRAGGRRMVAPRFQEQFGLLVTRSARNVSVKDSTFKGHGRDVVFYGAAKKIDVSGCRFLGGSGTGPNLLITGSGTVRDCGFEAALGGIALQGSPQKVHRLVLQRCVFESAVRTAVEVSPNAQAKVTACRFDGVNKGILAMQGSKVDIEDSECRDALVALDVFGAGSVSAHRLKVTGGETAVSVSAGPAPLTTVRLVDCLATGATETAVQTKSAGVIVTLERCRLGACNLGVCVVAGAMLHAIDMHVAECKVGVSIGMPDAMIREPCDRCGRSGAAAMAHAWRALHSSGRPWAQCVHDGLFAAADLERVVMEQCIAGLQVSGAGRVTAQGVDVRGAVGAFTLSRFGDVNAFEGCTASGASDQQVSCLHILGPEQQFRIVEERAVEGIAVRDGPVNHAAAGQMGGAHGQSRAGR